MNREKSEGDSNRRAGRTVLRRTRAAAGWVLSSGLALFSAGAVARGETPAGAAPGVAVPAIGVDEISAGDVGWGLSVFRGNKTERFEVEILGVIRDIQPDTSYVIGRLTGQGLEKTGVIAGMSGSPVYVGDRLLGAVAFAWPFSHEAIAGITPIGAMRGIESAAPWGAAPARPVPTLAALAAGSFDPDGLGKAIAELGAVAASAHGARGRAALLWGAAGFSERTIGELGRWLPAVATAGGAPDAPPAGVRGNAAPEAPATAGTPAATLEPGDAVAELWIDGDLRLAATGTVTDRTGDRILAFGHPVTGLGEAVLPMATADVVTVLSSAASSFKLANSGPVVGAFERDHPAGVIGTLGRHAPTVPMRLSIAGPAPRRFDLELARVPRILPVLAAIGTLGALDVAAPNGGVEGLDLAVAFDLGPAGKLELAQSFDGPGAPQRTVLYLLAVADFLARNDLGELEIRRLDVEVVPFVAPRTRTLVGLHAARSQVEPGETVDLFLDWRPYRGAIERQGLAVKLPPDLPAGRYTLLVGDGASASAARQAIEPEDPVTLPSALTLLRTFGSARELVVLGVLQGRGLASRGDVMPRLPGSVRSIWAASGTKAGTPLRMAVAQFERIPQEEPLSGLLRLDLEVRRAEPVAATAESAPAAPPAEPAKPSATPEGQKSRSTPASPPDSERQEGR